MTHKLIDVFGRQQNRVTKVDLSHTINVAYYCCLPGRDRSHGFPAWQAICPRSVTSVSSVYRRRENYERDDGMGGTPGGIATDFLTYALRLRKTPKKLSTQQRYQSLHQMESLSSKYVQVNNKHRGTSCRLNVYVTPNSILFEDVII